MNKTERKPSLLKKIIIIAVLIVFCAAAVLLYRGGFELSGVNAVLSGDSSEEFFYENAGTSCFAELDGSLVRASASGLDYIDKDGTQTKIAGFSTNRPVLSSFGERAVLYDVGGKKTCVFDKTGVIAEIDSEIAVINASLNEKGWTAVCEQENGYNGAVRVYNDEGALVYEWYSGSGYVLSAAVSPNCKTLAVLTAAKDGSEIVFLPLNSTEEKGRYNAADTLFVDLCFMDNSHVSAISENEWVLVGTDCDVKTSHSFNEKYLSHYSMPSGGTTAIVLSDYQVGTHTEILTVSPGGKLLGSFSTERTVTDISANGRHVSVLYEDGVGIYSSKMTEKAVWTEAVSGNHIFTEKNGSAMLVDTYSAKIYHK